MRVIASLATALCFSLAVGCGVDSPPLEVVDSVDLDAYQGTWYEIARLPNAFEKNCVAVTATYTMEGDTVDVLNRCVKGDFDGKVKEANGIARVVEGDTNARLKVSFFRPFYGDYQIMAVDEQSYALVGEPKREYLWILSRTPTIDADLERDLLDEASRQGFIIEDLEWTPQP